ncbi:MAG: zinc ABC transporter substrate-binding protein [Actinobacteria bacterium HGW-Actinobacteria-2]|nr:MAG: zinc ABC transporter substrate-binding protein [Actinobacteria bacterium HGW-Actinobacteria-2]
MKMKFGILSSAVIATALALTGCAGANNAASTDPGAASSKVNVTVSAYPLQFLAERIIGTAGTVTNLTAPGQEPHDLELSAKQIAEMSSTDALFYIANFQAAVDEAIKTSPPKIAVDVSSGLTLLTAGEDGADSGGELPATAIDPHIWLSPANMATMAHTMSAALSTAKPELAATFQTNTDKLVADLTGLKDSFTTGLKTCDRTQFITSHAAFGYLAHEFGLTQVPIAGLDPTEEPTAARIAAVQALAKKYGVTTIFFETLVSNAVAKSIAGDLGLKAAVLDPIEGITPTSAGTDYIQVMQSNLTALQEANGCK